MRLMERERAIVANTDGEILNVQESIADRAMNTQLLCVLVMCCGSALRTLERAVDTEGATGWVREHEPDTAGRHASLLLRILSYAFTDDTRGSLDTLDLHVQKHESSTGTPLAEPLKVALVQRGVKDTDFFCSFGF